MIKPKVHIGTPMYGGMATGTYIESIMLLNTLLQSEGIELAYSFTYNESLITRARNRICDEFIKTTDHSHLLWCDADIGFDPKDVLRFIHADKDIIGAACVKKNLNWGRIKQVCKNGHTPDDLMSVSGDFVVHWLQSQTAEICLNEPQEVLRLGTGFLMIKREVFLAMKREFPDRYYSPIGDSSARDGPIHEFFQSRIEPESRQYLSEDFGFCDDARSLGFKIWLAPWVKTSHTGSFKFEGDMISVAQATGTL